MLLNKSNLIQLKTIVESIFSMNVLGRMHEYILIALVLLWYDT